MDPDDRASRDQIDGNKTDDLLISGSLATRRKFLKQVAGTSAAITLGPRLMSISSGQAAETEAGALENSVDIDLKINGKDHALKLDPRVTLLDALREHLHLTGSKKGCDHGHCGACTVLANERRINSCLSLAVAGLDLGAETPEEIALAIVAEIQGIFTAASCESLRNRKAPIHAISYFPAIQTNTLVSTR